MARTASLKLTPAALLTLKTRSSDQDWAAQRRAPPILTLNIVCGAVIGSVSCCSNSAARASFTVEGASPTTDPAVLARAPNGDEPPDFGRGRRGSVHIARTSVSA